MVMPIQIALTRPMSAIHMRNQPTSHETVQKYIMFGLPTNFASDCGTEHNAHLTVVIDVLDSHDYWKALKRQTIKT